MKNILVTPSYEPDFERCRLLVETANRYLTDVDTHLLVIDRRDQAVFKPLVGGRVRILHKEELLPHWIRPMPWGRNWWLSFRGLPVRGWILQQVVKMAVAQSLEADAFVYADSDVCFIRQWDLGSIWNGEKLRLFRESRRGVMTTGRRYRNWYREASRYSVAESRQQLKGGYIAQLNSWRHDNVIELIAQIERISSRSWQDVLLNTLDFSEYTLYGSFVEEVLKFQGHFVDEHPLTLSSWYFSLRTKSDLLRFLESVKPHHVGVHIQSNLALRPTEYRDLVLHS